MIEQNIFTIAKACDGVIINKGNLDTIKEISTDTRTIEEGNMFVPLIGENFDGHTFIDDAIRKGAKTVLVRQDRLESISNMEGVNVIRVKDTLRALGKIAHYYKGLFHIPFIGVTGSVGKTTTKDLIAGVLANKYKVHKNIGNFNNEIGLPLTLFNLENGHDISVLEMGMSSYGEILNLTNIVRPNIAVITNIGLSHIEYFNNKQNIMKAKMEITANLTKKDYLLVNGDDENLKTIDRKDKDYNIVFYGLNNNNDFYPSDIRNLGEEGSSFKINIGDSTVQFKIKQLGIHNIYNGLVAIWIGLKYGMTAEEIQKGLDNIQPSRMRLEITDTGNIKIINDAYNASPDSMKASLDVLDSIKSTRRIAVLGNMFEMGSFSETGHRNVGYHLSNKQIDLLITVGDLAKWIGLGAKEKGFKGQNIISVSNNKEAIDFLNKCIQKEDAILIKGSRSMSMEQIAQFLQERS